MMQLSGYTSPGHQAAVTSLSQTAYAAPSGGMGFSMTGEVRPTASTTPRSSSEQESVEVADSKTYWYKRLDQRMTCLIGEVSKGLEAAVSAIHDHSNRMEALVASAMELYQSRQQIADSLDSYENVDGGQRVQSTYSVSDEDDELIPPGAAATQPAQSSQSFEEESC
ncbi:hypothetical protein FOZ60_009940 [Perkinsus olseni]|uniref:Uncharacterized protein n=1 Tax=Perkinsus olseni TaxID=32597 RepID=A0A7J6PNZ1_PEROL|nr:hypothetical protein FOZ60_009940 [Perkinsus olseni]